MEKTKNQLTQRIKDLSAFYPLMATKWEVTLAKENLKKKEINEVTFGQYQTSLFAPINLYKPISKYIDFNKIKNEK